MVREDRNRTTKASDTLNIISDPTRTLWPISPERTRSFQVNSNPRSPTLPTYPIWSHTRWIPHDTAVTPSVFSKMLTTDTPYLAREECFVSSEYVLLSHYIVVSNIVSYLPSYSATWLFVAVLHVCICTFQWLMYYHRMSSKVCWSVRCSWSIACRI